MIAASTRYFAFPKEDDTALILKSFFCSNVRTLMTFAPAVDTGSEGGAKTQEIEFLEADAFASLQGIKQKPPLKQMLSHRFRVKTKTNPKADALASLQD